MGNDVFGQCCLQNSSRAHEKLIEAVLQTKAPRQQREKQTSTAHSRLSQKLRTCLFFFEKVRKANISIKNLVGSIHLGGRKQICVDDGMLGSNQVIIFNYPIMAYTLQQSNIAMEFRVFQYEIGLQMVDVPMLFLDCQNVLDISLQVEISPVKFADRIFRKDLKGRCSSHLW